MQVSGYIVNWDEAVRRKKAGTLEEFGDALENGEPWIQDLAFYTDSHIQYSAIADAYEEFQDALPTSVRRQADPFMTRLITNDGYCTDLGDEGEIFALSISPKSAAKFAALSEQIDFKSFKEAFDAECSEETKEILGGEDPASAFEVNVLPYIEMWVSALQRAAAERKGILIHWG